MSERFVFSDGWLLVSIWGAGGVCDRKKLEAVGDMFNHAIFNDDEVVDGIRRLSKAGYASQLPDGQFQCSETGKAFVLAHWNAELGHITNMFKVCDALRELR